MKVHHGRCFCGAVRFTVNGEPRTSGAFPFWKPDALEVTQGAEHIATFNRTPKSCRKWCRLCGSHLYMHHSRMGLTDLYVALIASLDFRPAHAK